MKTTVHGGIRLRWFYRVMWWSELHAEQRMWIIQHYGIGVLRLLEAG